MQPQMVTRTRTARLLCGFAAMLVCALCAGRTAPAQTVRVDTTPAHALKFDPDQALGSSMDILPTSLVDKVYSEPILKESLSAGWGPITYRQNTELTIAAWHWNANGTWSDCLLYTSPSPRDLSTSRMPSSA